MRAVLLAVSVLGAALFGTAFVVSFTHPVLIEKAVKEAVRREVEKRVAERIASLEGSRLAKFAMRALERNKDRIAAVVAEMQDAGCTCRKFLGLEILTLTSLNEQLVRLIRTKYMEVVASLMRELRIFTGANALVFLLLGATTYGRRRAGLQLLLPAVVLIGAATLVASLYLFGQNWFHTILFSDYVGLGYFGYLGAAAVFLTDVVFNHARVSTFVVNALFEMMGVAIEAVAC